MSKEEYEKMGLSEEEIAALEEGEKTEEELAAEKEAAETKEAEEAKAAEDAKEKKEKEAADEGKTKEEIAAEEQAAKDAEEAERIEKDKGEIEEKIDVPVAASKMGPLVDAEVAQARIDEIKTALEGQKAELTTLKEKYEEGTYDVDEYDAKKDEVNAARETLLREQTVLETKMDLSGAIQIASVQAGWEASQAHYLSLHPEIKGDENLLALFANNVNNLLGSEEGKPMDDYGILKAAYKKMSYLIPENKKSEEQKAEDKKERLIADAKKTAAGKAKDGLPQTLKDVTAAGDNDGAGKFAHLEELTGVELEKALEKLTEAELEEWGREA